MPLTLVHPGNESKPQAAPAPARLQSLKGKKIGLLDISKPGGSFFLDRLEQLFRERYEATDIMRVKKPTYTKNAPQSIIDQLRTVDAVVEGLAD
ncbi:MAG TPA: hypothetical protein VHN74_22225 [Candidatus Angelobacter sp.]|jgi:hypothetical protein|nr:hypothetical protein [Candidatus Angelobacter sp.]